MRKIKLKFDIQEFVKIRDKAFRTLNVEDIKFYCDKYKIPYDLNNVNFWAGLHKCRVESVTIEEELKEESRQWLRLRGYKTTIGG